MWVKEWIVVFRVLNVIGNTCMFEINTESNAKLRLRPLVKKRV